MLTAHTDEIDTVLGLETGADDYLTRPFSPRGLRARVEAIMRRRARDRPPVLPPSAPSPASPAQSHVGAGIPDGTQPPAMTVGDAQRNCLRLHGLERGQPTYCVRVDGVEIAVTPTEFTLLHAVLAGGRTVRTKASLVRRLRDEEADSGTFVSEADERSVEVHVGNLRRKLGDDAKSPRWVETVRGVGYRSAPAR